MSFLPAIKLSLEYTYLFFNTVSIKYGYFVCYYLHLGIYGHKTYIFKNVTLKVTVGMLLYGFNIIRILITF